jgi:hypothetical protein
MDYSQEELSNINGTGTGPRGLQYSNLHYGYVDDDDDNDDDDYENFRIWTKKRKTWERTLGKSAGIRKAELARHSGTLQKIQTDLLCFTSNLTRKSYPVFLDS